MEKLSNKLNNPGFLAKAPSRLSPRKRSGRKTHRPDCPVGGQEASL
ncbi:MAG: hypothetical protein ACLS43_09555 [Evtepia gabavorous]